MTARRLRDEHADEHGDERGAALLIALGFLSLFGLFIATLLAQTEVNLKATGVTRAVNDRSYAADGGLEWGIEALRTSDANCADVAAGEQVLAGTPDINGRTVTVTCRALAGSAASPAAGPWSVVTTSGAADSFSVVGGAAAPVGINGGDVYVTGDMALAGTVAVTGGDVAAATAGCTQPPGVSIGEPDLWSCAAGPAPTVVAPLPPAPPIRSLRTSFLCVSTGHTWTIHHPGKYTTGLGETLDLGARNYFESGVYYFENVNLSFTSRTAIGGEPAPGETNVLAAACPNDSSAGPLSEASGKGVVFILGGTSTITLSDFGAGATQVELFTRTPTGGGPANGFSIMTVPSPAPAGYVAHSAAAALTVNQGTARVAVHGLVHSPDASVSVWATSAQPPLMAGVVASRFVVQTNPGATGPLAAVAAQGRRTVLLTSSAAGAAPGEVATVRRAVVKIANDPGRSPTVRSWRAQ